MSCIHRSIATGHTNLETHAIYTNIDKRLAKVISGSLDKLYAEREKARNDEAASEYAEESGFVN